MEGYLKGKKLKRFLSIYVFSKSRKQNRQERSGLCASNLWIRQLLDITVSSYPSFNHPALEACSQDRIEEFQIQLTH